MKPAVIYARVSSDKQKEEHTIAKSNGSSARVRPTAGLQRAR